MSKQKPIDMMKYVVVKYKGRWFVVKSVFKESFVMMPYLPNAYWFNNSAEKVCEQYNKILNEGYLARVIEERNTSNAE